MDIVALAALAERAFACHTEPAAIESPWERLGVARFFETRGREAEALAVLEAVIQSGEDHPAWVPSARLFGFLLKRAGRFEDSANAWRRICLRGIFDPIVKIVLAQN